MEVIKMLNNLLIINFEYYDKETGTYEKDQFECVNSFQEFKDYLQDNNILNYDAIDVFTE